MTGAGATTSKKRTEFPGVPVALWGSLVAKERDQQGLSQRDLARETGLTQQTVSKIEKGTMCTHDLNKVAIARALAVPVGSLFPWPPDAPPLADDDA